MPEIVDLRPGVDISVGRRGGSGRARRPRVIGLFEKASTLLTSPGSIDIAVGDGASPRGFSMGVAAASTPVMANT